MYERARRREVEKDTRKRVEGGEGRRDEEKEIKSREGTMAREPPRTVLPLLFAAVRETSLSLTLSPSPLFLCAFLLVFFPLSPVPTLPCPSLFFPPAHLTADNAPRGNCFRVNSAREARFGKLKVANEARRNASTLRCGWPMLIRISHCRGTTSAFPPPISSCNRASVHNSRARAEKAC